MNRTELMTEILKLTGHKRSLHPDVNFGIQRLLDKYEKSLEKSNGYIIEVELNDDFSGGEMRMDNDLYEILSKYRGKTISARSKQIDVHIAIKE